MIFFSLLINLVSPFDSKTHPKVFFIRPNRLICWSRMAWPRSSKWFSSALGKCTRSLKGLKVCLRKCHLHHLQWKMRAPFVMKIKMEKKKLPVYLVDITFTKNVWRRGWSQATSAAHCVMMISSKPLRMILWDWPQEDLRMLHSLELPYHFSILKLFFGEFGEFSWFWTDLIAICSCVYRV